MDKSKEALDRFAQKPEEAEVLYIPEETRKRIAKMNKESAKGNNSNNDDK